MCDSGKACVSLETQETLIKLVGVAYGSCAVVLLALVLGVWGLVAR